MRSEKNQAVRRAELRRFLMARRAAISPESVGLPGGTRRRTPGLRREELAALAGIGVTWYTWFEQGRDIQVSVHTLEAIARALRFTPSDTEYLFALCDIPRLSLPPGRGEHVEKCVQDTLDVIQGAPVFIGNSCGDVLAYNQLADLVFEFDAHTGPFARNHHWRFFMDPKRREKYLEWETLAEIYVPFLRFMHGKMADDAYFNGLIRELHDGSTVFRRLWDAQITAPLLESVKIGMNLPRFGSVWFTSVRFYSPASTIQAMLVLTPADEKTAHVMQELSRPARGASEIGSPANGCAAPPSLATILAALRYRE